MSAPFQFRAGAIWSLRQIMEAFSAGSFFSIGVILELVSGDLRDGSGDEGYLRAVSAKLMEIRERLDGASLDFSVMALDRIVENIDIGTTSALVTTRIDALAERVRDELDSKYFLYLTASQAEQYCADDNPFGPLVETNFASANDDIYEAVKCLALERATACVMHLMRVTEVPLKALGKALGIGPQTDWGSYIREVDKALEARLKAVGKRSPDEQFYADVAVEFSHVKRAWRNPSMHVDRSYTIERAQEILAATKSFMRHLATRLTE